MINKVSEKTAAVCLAILALAGSFVVFYASNMLLSDLSNMYYVVSDVNFISSIPCLMLALDFVLASFFAARICKAPQYKKRMTSLYSVVLAAFSLTGIASSVASGTLIYGSFTAPYPFPCYAAVGTAVHGVLLILAIIVRVRTVSSMPDDPEKRRMTLAYVLYSALLAILVFFAYNRLGAFLWAPWYVHLRTLYMTFPFYLSLLLPIALAVMLVLALFGRFEGRHKAGIAYGLTVMILNFVLGGATICLGMTSTKFISAVSPALGIERLGTGPFITLAQFGLVFLFALFGLIYAIRLGKRAK